MIFSERTTRKFQYVIRPAYEALLEASMITRDTWTVTINKALQVHEDAFTAEVAGGSFVIQGPDSAPQRPQYQTTGLIRAAIVVNLSPKSITALTRARRAHHSSPDEKEYDPSSLILNEALLRWRDVVVTQMRGGQILLQKSADKEVVVMTYQ